MHSLGLVSGRRRPSTSIFPIAIGDSWKDGRSFKDSFRSFFKRRFLHMTNMLVVIAKRCKTTSGPPRFDLMFRFDNRLNWEVDLIGKYSISIRTFSRIRVRSNISIEIEYVKVFESSPSFPPSVPKSNELRRAGRPRVGWQSCRSTATSCEPKKPCHGHARSRSKEKPWRDAARSC